MSFNQNGDNFIYKCYVSVMGEKKRAEIAFNVTEKMLGGRPSLWEKLKADRDALNNLPDNVDQKKPELTLAKGGNEQLPGVSSLVDCSSDPQKGNFLVAKEAINVGSNLIVENPVASVVLPKFAGSHCHHCLRRVEAPIGCKKCCGVAFCSVSCMQEAKYHKFECELLDLMIGT